MNYPWPGNVRELENAVERAVVLCTGKTLKREHFPFELQDRIRKVEAATDVEPKGSLADMVEGIEKKMIESAIKQSGGNKRKAAKMLGVTERILSYKISKLKLEMASED